MLTRYLAIPFVLLLTINLLLPRGSVCAGAPNATTSAGGGASPILFVENTGQFADGARFQVWAEPGTLWLAEDALWITVLEQPDAATVGRGAPAMSPADELLAPQQRPFPGSPDTPASPQKAVNLKLSFPGANPHPRLEPFDRVDTHVSYFLGTDRAKWRANVPVWDGVRYVDLYPGVDLEITGTHGQWAWRLVQRTPSLTLPLRGEGSESDVRLRVEGADVVVADGGGLRLTTPLGELVLPLLQTEGAPVAEPQVESVTERSAAFDVRQPFASSAVAPTTRAANTTSGDPARPGDLRYATFLGGSVYDVGTDLAVDGAGQAYVTGETYSADFPASVGPGYDTSYNGGGDAFVVKLDAAGTGLRYATFLGGSESDWGDGIAVDGAGQAYVTGYTRSADFPAAAGPGYDSTYSGTQNIGDAFVVKLDATGSLLRYATFLGGSAWDSGYKIATDSAGSAYVTGITASPDFPAAFGPGYNTGFSGILDGFVVKLDPNGIELTYATFLGGRFADWSEDIAVDGTGQAYITGITLSPDFPAVLGPGYDLSLNDGQDGFVVKLDMTGTQLVYATFLGGSSTDWGAGIVVNGTGQAFVTGATYSVDFPAARGPGYDSTYHGTGDAFVVKLNATGTRLLYATFLGGRADDIGSGIAVDSAGRAYIAGWTTSFDFPAARASGYDPAYHGDIAPYYGSGDGFLVRLDASGTRLLYATFLGGNRGEYGAAVAMDAAGHAYVTGTTFSADFPAFRGPGFDTSYQGSGNAFVVKLATVLPELIAGTVWHDEDGDGLRDSGEPGIPGIQVCAQPMGRTASYCATTDDNGAYEIPAPAQVTFLVAPVNPPAGMTRTTQGFYLPVSLVKGEQFIHADFGFR